MATTTRSPDVLSPTGLSSAAYGAVTAVRGSVVDVRFDGRLPFITSVLHTGADRQIVIEVRSQLDAHHVRGMALTPTQGLARGMPAQDSAPRSRQFSH